MLYLLGIFFGWVQNYPLTAVVFDTIITFVSIVAIILLILVKKKGLRWTIG